MPRYKTIVIDPPWYERGGGKIKRGADRHYELLKTPDIIRVIYSSGQWWPDENSHLYLWVTNNFLEDGLFVMKALGYRYITTITWLKDSIGLGQYFRGMSEHMLFGVRGRLKPITQGRTGFSAKKGEHSQKPETAYEMIERVSPPPRLEMFARRPRNGWDCWGDDPVIEMLSREQWPDSDSAGEIIKSLEKEGSVTDD